MAAVRRWMFLLGLGAVALFIVLSNPATSQTVPDGETGDARCLSCHAAEGMEYAQVIAPTVEEIPRGGTFTLNFTVQNPWLHHIEEAAMSLNLSQAPGVSFVGGEDPVFHTESGTLAPGNDEAIAEHTFTVTPNTTELNIDLQGDPGPATGLGETDWDLTIVTPAGCKCWNSTGDRPPAARAREIVHLTVEDVLRGGPGEWTVQVKLPGTANNPFSAGTPQSAAYRLDVGVYGNVTGINEIYVRGTQDRVDWKQTDTFTFALRADEDVGDVRILYKLRLKAIADVPEDHPEGHPPDMQDVGEWVGWNTLETTGGDELKVSAGEARAVADPTPFILMRSYAYALGYASTFLLVPSLVLGGVFGRSTVLWLNKVSLGARRRVLWHNAASFGLLFFALLHMVLFLMEPAKAWTIGMVWGGAAIACLVLLGVTGAMQRRFVAKWGFGAWRYMHFGVATLMVAFILLHLGLEGTTYDFVRSMLAG